jgi:hypothetical protein
MSLQQFSEKTLEIIENSNHSVFGFRAIENKYAINIGDDVPHSYDWDFENDCSSDSQLSGVSVIAICDYPDLDDVLKSLQLAISYLSSNSQLILVGGDHAGLGDDKNELLISNGICLLIK